MANEAVITITAKDMGAARAFAGVRDEVAKTTAATEAANRATNTYRDSMGRLRDEKGRYVTETGKASQQTDKFGQSLSGAKGHADNAGRSFAGLRGHTEGLRSAFGSIATTAAGVFTGLAAFAGATRIFDGIKSSVIDFNSQMQNASVGFTSLLGSAEAANKVLGDLQAFARSTPFEFPELVQSSQRLLAFGFAAKDIIPIMTAVGDATAAMGNVSGAALDKVTLAIGQIGTKGKASTEELLQLTEAGIPAFKILADGLGVTTGKLQQMVQDGVVPADKAIKILLEGMENRAPGAMDKMSRTFSGAMSNVKDSMNQLIGGAFKPFFDQLTTGANKLADFLQTSRVKQFADLVSSALGNLSKGIGAMFDGRQTDADRYFSNFVDQAGRASKEIQLAFLKIADAFMPAVEPVTELFGNLVQSAVSWGANLITSFASGMLQAAGSILSQALSSIFEYIAGWFPHSPAKHGPFKDIYLFGADMLNSLFEGMGRADFSALDRVMGGVEDALRTQLSMGAIGEEGLIPRMIGSEAGVARALADMREFGSISEDTLGILNDNLGTAAPRILDLLNGVTALAAKDRDIADLGKEIDGVDRELAGLTLQLNAVNRAFADQKRPIEDAIQLQERYYAGLIRNIDATIRKLQDQLRAQEATLDPLMNALDEEERGLNLSEAQRRLTEAQNQHLTRRAQLEADVVAAQRGVASAQHGISTLGAGADAYTRQQAQLTLQDAQTRLTEAQNRLAREGVQTNADLLAINRARRDVAQAQLAIDTNQARTELANAQAEKDRLEREQRDAIDPMKLQLESINDSHREAVRLLEDQMRPLSDQKQALEDRKRLLEEERKPLEDAVTLAETRLSHERDVADAYKDQLDLLNQIATSGAGGAKGPKGGGAGLPNVDLSRLGLNIPNRGLAGMPGPIGAVDPMNMLANDPTMMAGVHQSNIDQQIAGLASKIKEQFKKSVKEGFGEAFEDWSKADTALAGIGAAIGFKMGGPLGAAAGAAAAKSFADEFESMTRNEKIGSGGTAAIFGGITLWFTKSPQLAALAAGFGAFIGDELVVGLYESIKAGANRIYNGLTDLMGAVVDNDWSGTVDLFKGIGGAIVDGVWTGITEGWRWFTKEVSGLWDELVKGVKKFLGIASPSTVFHEIGTDILQGLWNGVVDKWNEAEKWFKALPGETVKAVGDVAETLKEKGRNLIGGLYDGLKSKWHDATDGPLTWLSKVGQAAFDAIGDVTRALWNKGLDLVKGLGDGMSEAWNRYVQPILDRIPGAGNAIQGVAGAARNLNEQRGAPKTLPGVEEVDKGVIKTPTGGGSITGMVGSTGAWEPGPNGTQIKFTGPQTYWVKYPDGRMAQFSTLDPSGPLYVAAGASGGSTAFAGAALTGYGATRPASTHAISGNGISEQNTNNFGGIVGLLQTIYSDQFGTFTNYSSTAPGLEAIVGPLEDFLRRLPGMSDAQRDAINRLVMQSEAARNPVNSNYDPMSDPVARTLRDALGQSAQQAFDPVAKALSEAAGKLDQAADKLQGEGPTQDDRGEFSDEEGDGGRTRTGTRRKPPSRATGGPIGSDGMYQLHAGEFVVPPGNRGGGYGSVNELAAALAMAISGMSIEVDGRTLGQVVSQQQGRLAAYVGAL